MAKKKQTFADRAKTIMKKYEPRLGEKFDKGDVLALEAMNQELKGLQEEQEKERIKQLVNNANPEQLSQLSQALSQQDAGQQQMPQQIPQGMPQGAPPSQGMGQPQFAYGGGLLPIYQGPGEKSNTLNYNRGNLNVSIPNFNENDKYGGLTQEQMAMLAKQGDSGVLEAITQSVNSQDVNPQGSSNGEFTPYQFRAPWFGAAATALGSVLGNRQIDFKQDPFNAQQLVPNLVDYSREREQFGRDRDIANQMIRRSGAGIGSRAGLMQNLQAGATGTQRQAGRLFSKSLQGEQNQNAQIRNQANQFNAQQRSMADRLNNQYGRENQLINAQRRTNQIAGVTGAVTGYGRDLLQANRDTGLLRLEESKDYPIQQRNDSRIKQLLGIDADPYKKYVGPMRSINSIG
jgi:hypothetical protein